MNGREGAREEGYCRSIVFFSPIQTRCRWGWEWIKPDKQTDRRTAAALWLFLFYFFIIINITLFFFHVCEQLHTSFINRTVFQPPDIFSHAGDFIPIFSGTIECSERVYSHQTVYRLSHSHPFFTLNCWYSPSAWLRLCRITYQSNDGFRISSSSTTIVFSSQMFHLHCVSHSGNMILLWVLFSISKPFFDWHLVLLFVYSKLSTTNVSILLFKNN